MAEDAELAVKFFRDAKLKPETVSVCWGGGGGGGRGGAAQCTVSTYDGHSGQPIFLYKRGQFFAHLDVHERTLCRAT